MAARAAHHLTENIFEDIAHPAGTHAAERTATTAAIFKSSVAEAIISRTLLRVFQRLIGFAKFLELGLSFRIARVAIRMIFHRALAERAFQRCGVHIAGDAKDFVIISFGHETVAPSCGSLAGKV